MIITEDQLDLWVRGHTRDAQGVIVDLVYRLVAASCQEPKERRFPHGDSIGQPGVDGFLNVGTAFEPFVPVGKSFWEIGTGGDARKKATDDYTKLTAAVPQAIRQESTFLFITPLSARKSWRFTFKEGAQRQWIEERKSKGEWRDVRIIDGTKLIDWMEQLPSVEHWLCEKMGGPKARHIETLEFRWGLIRNMGTRPNLTPELFLANRNDACTKLNDVFNGTQSQLTLTTRFPDDVVDFVSAYLANQDNETRTDIYARSIIVSNVDAWHSLVLQKKKLILVADTAIDLSGASGTKLIKGAQLAGHSVIFGGHPGGVLTFTSAPLSSPRVEHVRMALERAGYNPELARGLAQKTAGHLGSLLRCIHDVSQVPDWAEDSASAALIIAEAIGAWSDNSASDRAVVEGISGNGFGEWIGAMRKIALRPNTPLSHHDGNWTFSLRYEGWFALGPQFFDEHLVRLRTAAVSVLTEADPRFELPSGERYASKIYGKVLAHSPQLRKGLAESLALLGSHPQALTSCSIGRPETTASLTVRDILANADWKRWASLDDLLPLLAEAAPGEFLAAIETALDSSPCPFDQLFAEEGGGIAGRTYMSGVLWALETLAWHPDHLSRVVLCLGRLAERDPGGQWSNRPANSLVAIFLPWLPQTCAPVEKRAAAISTLLAELPEVGWKLVLSLLPQSDSMSTGTRKPAWREMIPEDWPASPSTDEYKAQIQIYSELAITNARNDRTMLAELIGHFQHLPPATQDHVLEHLGSRSVTELPETERLRLWTALIDVVTRHRKYTAEEWAMKPAQVDKIAAVAARLAPVAPTLRHQRLFCERDIEQFEGTGSYEDQLNALNGRRQKAIEEIAAIGGPQAVLSFADAVESPWRVGFAFAAIAGAEADAIVLPDLLESDVKSRTHFAAGYVVGRFSIGLWTWVDHIITTGWTPEKIGQFLSYLPFSGEAWDRATRLLGPDDAAYWSKSTANPYQAGTDIERAVEALSRHGRPIAASRCIYKLVHTKSEFDCDLAIQTLLAALNSKEPAHSMDTYQTVGIIKALQDHPEVKPDDLFRVEWAYLPLLDKHNGAAPKLLNQTLAIEPAFFCEVIRLVFQSANEDLVTKDPADYDKAMATNGYRLLNEWSTPPGLQANDSFDRDALNQWLDEVKRECSRTGHLEVAMTVIGQSLTHAPKDPDGLWIHRAAAAALNSNDAQDMRVGFCQQLFNSRGAHVVDPTGAPEIELATKYRAQADSIEAAGYVHLASTLRELAASYEHQAEVIRSRERNRE